MELDSDILDQYLDNISSDRLLTRPQHSEELNDAIVEHQFIVDGIHHHCEHLFKEKIRLFDENLDRQGFFSDDNEIVRGISYSAERDVLKSVAAIDKELAAGNFFTEEKEESDTTKIRRIGRRSLLAWAASIAIVIAAGFYLFRQPLHVEEILATHLILPNQPISALIEDERSEVGFADDGYDLTPLERAVEFYDQGNYSVFLDASRVLIDDRSIAHYWDELRLLRAAVLLKLDQAQQAESILEEIENADADVLWYLGLARIAQQDRDGASDAWQTISEDPRVKALLDQL